MQRDGTKIRDERERIAFEIYLRTGRVVAADEIPALQFKFNPWHDSDDGRFTFAGHGTYYGNGTNGARDKTTAAAARRPTASARPDKFRRGGGSFGGAGTNGSWPERSVGDKRASRSPATTGGSGIAAKCERRRHAVPGDFHRSACPIIVAANHFAQDSNFNSGRYRVIDDGWVRDIKAGKTIHVEIAPHYAGRSTRPDSLRIVWRVNGLTNQETIPNAPTEKKESGMPQDKYDLLGPIYAAIGHECAAIVGGSPDGLYLYAYAGDGYSGGAIFMDEGDLVRYYDLTSNLFQLIREAWEAAGPDEKWEVMEYNIKNGGFDTRLVFPDEIDAELSITDLRSDFLSRRFGDKPVVYPKWEEVSALALDENGEVTFADEPGSVIVPPTRDASGTLRFPTTPTIQLPRNGVGLTRDASGTIRFPETPEN